MPSKQDPPESLRLPKEWNPEIERAHKRRGISRHAYLVRAIRRALDGERREDNGT